MFERILVPTDGTERSAVAVAAALPLAHLGGGSIVAVHVIATQDALARDEHARQQADDALAYVMRRAAEADVACATVLATGPPAAGIVQAARDTLCDLIVITPHERSGLAARVLGSTTRDVLAQCVIPVLVVR